MSKIVTFGEIMMRLQPQSYRRLVQTENFTVYFGGSEANTAAALSQWGENAAFITRLPANELGDDCIRNLRSLGVDTSFIARGNGRIGVYYTEKGASQRPPEVLYDRKYSDFSLAESQDFDFDKIMNNADWFHFSGITPALGGNLVSITKSAVDAAHRAGTRISCDFNFRSKLWSADDARRVMSELITNIDLLIINENQANEIFGICSVDLKETVAQIAKMFNIGSVALTKRRTVSGEVNEFSAMLYSAGQCYESRTYSIFMIDKIGGGDAFSAGIIYGMANGKNLQDTVDFAAAAACYKHTIEGDMIAATVSDIEWVMHSDGKGRMIR